MQPNLECKNDHLKQLQAQINAIVSLNEILEIHNHFNITFIYENAQLLLHDFLALINFNENLINYVANLQSLKCIILLAS